jgi:hypothetical protein
VAAPFATCRRRYRSLQWRTPRDGSQHRHAPPRAQELRTRLEYERLSTEVLEVKAAGESPQEAVLLADGVAMAYVEYSNGATSASSSTEIDGLVVRAGSWTNASSSWKRNCQRHRRAGGDGVSAHGRHRRACSEQRSSTCSDWTRLTRPDSCPTSTTASQRPGSTQSLRRRGTRCFNRL